ncbi:glucose-6-phosphate isomerase [Oceanicoccus sagamiensis]|uniref:Glucose-6-phosphate isomerase n=1 Tax=Oceanicoccus sagamiensis TaxID=716816 RepID=A0A1X9NJU0_9GAMM|nr:glucose-6-phosphate isomerase [Oceanicoccus sagamiensis]ARN74243.1 glucose-6-phosphate isomerase [Oceanicoccus sagamiensis]
MSRNNLKGWQQLETMAAASEGKQIKALFANDSERFANYHLAHSGILFDYSKNRISDDVKAALVQLARECEVEAWRDAMFAGDKINRTEGRSVLHTALRSDHCPNQAIGQQVQEELDHIRSFSERARSGQLFGYSGQVITDVVCLGVGGSNLGPEMVTEALPSQPGDTVKLHYISSVDAVPLEHLLAGLSAATTLFIVASKTFTTTETLLNAAAAKRWLLSEAPETAIALHFVAVTEDTDKAASFGITPDYCFRIWDWVGGRFSLWSAIGLPIAIGRGYSAFESLLSGASAMDEHFRSADIAQNIPMMMALVGVWNTTFLNINTLAILPYDQQLHQLPSYLQQAEMESNGKSVNWQGEHIQYNTCPILWGQTGINGQHAFYQLLHQGSHDVASDFIVSANSCAQSDIHHQHLLANCFAQSQALMNGVGEEEVKRELLANGLNNNEIEQLAPHKVHAGNRPTNTLIIDTLDAFHLGALIALYEHKIFVQGIIWEIYSFDQWGVQLGKLLATNMLGDVQPGSAVDRYDSSTNGLLNHIKSVSHSE